MKSVIGKFICQIITLCCYLPFMFQKKTVKILQYLVALFCYDKIGLVVAPYHPYIKTGTEVSLYTLEVSWCYCDTGTVVRFMVYCCVLIELCELEPCRQLSYQ